MVPAHLGQVFVWLIGHHGLDPVGVADFYEVGCAHFGVVHRDDDPARPFHGGYLDLGLVDVRHGEAQFGQAGDTDKGDIEGEAL